MTGLNVENCSDPRLYQVWLDHPPFGEGDGLTRNETSAALKRQGIATQGVGWLGSWGFVWRDHNDRRWRGDGSQQRTGKGTGKMARIIHEWNKQLKETEKVQGELLNELDSAPDDRYRREGMLTIRLGQAVFRRELLRIYRRKCWISGCDVERTLQAAHIKPHDGSNNVASNGMLLRADLHNLFDADLLWIEPVMDGYRVRLSPGLRGGYYDDNLHNRFLAPPGTEDAHHPDPTRLYGMCPGWWPEL